MEEKDLYTRHLKVTSCVLEGESKFHYTTEEIDTAEEVSLIHKGVLGYLAKAEGLTEETLAEHFDFEVEEKYASRDHTDYVSINEDTYYLYDALNRLADNECDRVQLWAYTKKVFKEVGDNGDAYDAVERNLLMSVEAVASPMGLKEFATNNSKPKINIIKAVPAEEKTMSFADLKKAVDKKSQEEDEDATSLLQEFEEAEDFVGEVEDKSTDEGVSEEDTLYTFEEVKELVDKAYQEGYQKAVEDLEKLV